MNFRLYTQSQHYPKDLIERIRNEYDKNSQIFKNDFIYRSIDVHDRTKKTLSRYDDKLLMLPEDIVYYIDQSKLYDNGKNKSWNVMHEEKFERERRIYEDKYTKLDPHYHKQKYEIVLDCENIGIFVFDSDEIRGYFDRCEPTSTGCISWNVVLEKDGEIFIRFNKDHSVNVTKRRNDFGKLRRILSDGIHEDRRSMT